MQSSWINRRKRAAGVTFQVVFQDGASERVAASFRSGAFPGVKQARSAADQFKARFDLFINGMGPDPREIAAAAQAAASSDCRTWAEAVDAYLDEIRRGPKTMADIRGHLGRFGPMAGICTVADITLERIAAGLRKIEARKLSAASVSKYAGYVLTFADWLEITFPPNKLKRFRADWHPYRTMPKADVHLYSEDEYKRLMLACGKLAPRRKLSAGQLAEIRERHAAGESAVTLGKAFGVSDVAIGKVISASRTLAPTSVERSSAWWRAWITLLFDCGLRYAEASRLRWSDVDLDGMTITIQRHAEDKAAGVWAWSPKSKAGCRLVPISPRLFARLKGLQAEQPDGLPYVFVTPGTWARIKANGGAKPGALLVQGIRAKFLKLCQLAKVTPGTFHDFRHSRITAWAADLPPKTVQVLAGHEQIATTLKHYTHVDQLAAVEAARAVHKSAIKLAQADDSTGD